MKSVFVILLLVLFVAVFVVAERDTNLPFAHLAKKLQKKDQKKKLPMQNVADKLAKKKHIVKGMKVLLNNFKTAKTSAKKLLKASQMKLQKALKRATKHVANARKQHKLLLKARKSALKAFKKVVRRSKQAKRAVKRAHRAVTILQLRIAYHNSRSIIAKAKKSYKKKIAALKKQHKKKVFAYKNVLQLIKEDLKKMVNSGKKSTSKKYKKKDTKQAKKASKDNKPEVELSDSQVEQFLCKLFKNKKGCKPRESQPTPAPETAPVEEVEADSVTAGTINQKGVDLIKSFEGWRSCKYKDAVGLWTIGYGHLIKSGERFDRCLTPAEGEALLRKDVAGFESCVTRAVTTSVNSNQFSALVSFAFNLGCGNLQSSTMLKRVNARAFSEVCNEMRKWNKAGGKVLPGLVRRREAECQLFNA